uniref:NADH:ubiquinone reductase (H(+)-translocating) n=1 Tax=Protostrongylus rufescens TaxID=321386 RepID=A0A059SEG8_PRORF|nr:NADH dehydrogenase subunit 5 [Protostrongylus rufescens]AGW80386.1 NADH dehydrogenase subunit 5 [Protostrongylus rufescens]
MNFLVFLMVGFLLMMLFFCFFGVFFVSFSLFEWEFLSVKLNFFFNSLLFFVILMVISLSVLIFSSYYMMGELMMGYYLVVLMIFVGSMVMLIFSSSAFSMLLSWDLLGISSFFLVLFYNNWDSNLGAMNTALTNRLGDYFLFCFLATFAFGNFFFFTFTVIVNSMVVLLLLSSFTKSAQFPFSGWLPKAMSAPTPVSSLVHSSTLVTAGLVLLMNFNLLVLGYSFLKVLLIIGLFTMFFSSLAALYEEDMKKVVALSTLSQMGFMVFTLGLGLHFVSFLHLVSHALFKSCLFIQMGYFIHSNYSQQDGRFYGSNGSLFLFVQLQLLVTLFCLCGLLFTSGMISKDYILEMFFYNFFYLWLSIFFVISVFLTFGYSYRLWKSFFLSFSKRVIEFSTSYLLNFYSFLLVFFSIVFLSWVSSNLFILPSVFLYMDVYLPLLYVMTLLVAMYLAIKLFMKFIVYKFFVDYFAKLFSYLGINLKFFDLGLVKGGNCLFFVFNNFSKIFVMFMSSLGYNSVVIMVFFLFM